MSEPKTAEVKVVPVEPTEAMIEAMDQAIFTHGNVVDAYRAMLAASPPAETGEGESSGLVDGKHLIARLRELEALHEARLQEPLVTYAQGLESGMADAMGSVADWLESGDFDAQPVSPSEGEAQQYHAGRIAEVMDEGDGFWKACSGCQEGVDGYVSARDYPHNKTFRCQPGGGCSECGGLGVIWDNIDYDDMARSILADEVAGASDQSDTERMRAVVMLADDAPVWADGIITDGERVAFAQKSEADHGGTYWAIDEGSGAIEWEPTHFIDRAALSATEEA